MSPRLAVLALHGRDAADVGTKVAYRVVTPPFDCWQRPSWRFCFSLQMGLFEKFAQAEDRQFWGRHDALPPRKPILPIPDPRRRPEHEPRLLHVERLAERLDAAAHVA